MFIKNLPGIQEGAGYCLGYAVGTGINAVSRQALVNPVNTAIFCAGMIFISKILKSVRLFNDSHFSHEMGKTSIGLSESFSYIKYTKNLYKPRHFYRTHILRGGMSMVTIIGIMNIFQCFKNITLNEFLGNIFGLSLFLGTILIQTIHDPLPQVKEGSLEEITELGKTKEFAKKLFIFTKKGKEYPICVIHNPKKECLAHSPKCKKTDCPTKFEMIIATSDVTLIEAKTLVLDRLKKHDVRDFSTINNKDGYLYFSSSDTSKKFSDMNYGLFPYNN